VEKQKNTAMSIVVVKVYMKSFLEKESQGLHYEGAAG